MNSTCFGRLPGLWLLVFPLLLSGEANAARSYTNKPPTISGVPSTTAIVGQPYRFTPQANDPENRTLVFSIYGLPRWASFDRATGTVSGTPGASDTGTTGRIVIAVSDRRSMAYLPEFRINIQAGAVVIPPVTNAAPVISGAPATAVSIGGTYGFQPAASDTNGDALGFTIANRPAWASFSTTTGRLSGTPTSAATHSGIVISVSDGKVSAALPAFAITVTGTSNRAPTISGTPLSSVNVGTAYSFTPVANDPDGGTLTFSIANKPAWANFNPANGQLSGTPTAANVGTFTGVVITVRDGTASTSLAPFSIGVTQVANGVVTLIWTAPTQNTDGTPLTNLGGYRIYFGTSASALTQTADITNASVSTYVISNLSPATWYFAIKARNAAGIESELSSIVSKAIN